MAQKLSVNLTGDLDVKRDSATCPGGTDDVGTGFKLQISDRAKSADSEISQKAAPIDATGGPVSLPYPANLEGRLFLLTVLEGGPFDVAVTHSTQGATVYPVKSTILIEPSDDEYITAIAINSGVGTIEWIVSGTEV
jgi:hypothetical protein